MSNASKITNEEAIFYLEYMKKECTEEDSPMWNALTKGIDAIRIVDNVQSCLCSKAESAAKDGAK